MDKLKVIAISGSGRTGSTLLSLLLSQDSSVFNLHQMRYLWRAFDNDEPCSCGQNLKSCPVYGRVLQDDRSNDIAANTQVALDALASVTGATVFIDSSKSPATARTLSQLPNVDLYVLNLVRDPRAVACSWHKRKRGISALINRSREWRKRQRHLEEWGPELGDHFMRVRYEDLATNPIDTISAIAEWADIPIPESLFLGPDRVMLDWSNQHLFPPENEGGLTRRESEVTITCAESWKRPENRWIHRIARFFAGAYGRRLYP